MDALRADFQTIKEVLEAKTREQEEDRTPVAAGSEQLDLF
jgi:hypothetical protein